MAIAFDDVLKQYKNDSANELTPSEIRIIKELEDVIDDILLNKFDGNSVLILNHFININPSEHKMTVNRANTINGIILENYKKSGWEVTKHKYTDGYLFSKKQ